MEPIESTPISVVPNPGMLSPIQQIQQNLSLMSREQLESLFVSISGEYEREPVHISEFLESKEFLGNYFKDEVGRVGKGVYKYWLDVLNDIYPSPFHSPYWLINFGGAVGLGKSCIAVAGMNYDLHRMECMINPQRSFRVLGTTKILFAIYSATLGLAQDVVWDYCVKQWSESSYFSDLVGDRLVKVRRKTDTLFPKYVDFFKGSRIGHSLGKAVIEAIMDESNFEVVQDQVKDSFTSLLRRMESRFVGEGIGTQTQFPGKIWVVSSEKEIFSTVNKIIDGYKGKKGVYIAKPMLWEVKPHKYGESRFYVYRGNEMRKPQILESSDPMIQTEPEMVIKVPTEHYDSFEADIVGSLRDLAGIPVGSPHKLFKNQQKINQALILKPLFQENDDGVITIDPDDEADQIYSRILSLDHFSNPINHAVPRFIHLDIGISHDKCGIASSYVKGWNQNTHRDSSTGVNIVEAVPEIITEFAIAVAPPVGKQLPLSRVRAFLFWLTSQGYQLAQITSDTYQSTDTIQILESNGYNAAILSVDKNVEPYMKFRDLCNAGCWKGPDSKILRKEMYELEISTDGKKVDHPSTKSGSKDLCDASCGSVWNAVMNAHKYRWIGDVDVNADSEEKTSLKNIFWNNDN